MIRTDHVLPELLHLSPDKMVFNVGPYRIYEVWTNSMCGICGIYGTSDEALVVRMVAALRHRGPDDNSIYTDDISLGHARLSIIDLSDRGKQPMSNENGAVWLSVNGEIYNFQELRAELGKNGQKSGLVHAVVYAYLGKPRSKSQNGNNVIQIIRYLVFDRHHLDLPIT